MPRRGIGRRSGTAPGWPPKRRARCPRSRQSTRTAGPMRRRHRRPARSLPRCPRGRRTPTPGSSSFDCRPGLDPPVRRAGQLVPLPMPAPTPWLHAGRDRPRRRVDHNAIPPEPMMSATRKHIEDYALIGDLRTAALIAADGSIDWLSLPRFDSPAVYAALLGTEEHGHWSLAPSEKRRCTRRRYRPGTLILETDWTTTRGAVRVTDFMDPTSTSAQVIRIVDGLIGEVPMHTTMSPRMTYGHTRPSLRRVGTHLLATPDHETLRLGTDVPPPAQGPRGPDSAAPRAGPAGWGDGRFPTPAGQRVPFPPTPPSPAPPSPVPPPDVIVEGRHTVPVSGPGGQLTATDTFWTDWS